MDLTVVAPACSDRATALLLGGVARQDVVTEVGIIQVIVALLPLASRGSRWKDGFSVSLSCR